MCGRFVSVSTLDAIADYFGATSTVAPLDANFNVAPTHAVYGVVARSTDPDAPLDKTVRAFRWGLIPSWANDHRIGARMVNARAETLKQKPSFRDLVKNRRVIIPTVGVPTEGGCHHRPGCVPGRATGLRKIRKKSPRTAQTSTTASTTELFCEPV